MKYIEEFKLLPGPVYFTLPNDLRYAKLLPDFLSTDERDDFRLNLTTQPMNWHYRTQAVKYVMNQNYYRAPEWDAVDWQNSIVVFGCSHVFGEGLAERETISHHLSTLTGRPVINLGQSGTGPMFSWHNSLLLDKWWPTPYAVVQVWSDMARIPYYENDKVSRIGYWSGGKWDNFDSRLKQLFELWNVNETNSQAYMYFTALACEQFWKSKTRYTQASFFKETATLLNIPQLHKMDFARDFIHYGTLTHRAAATIIESALR
jgi:hypothetical protein